MDRQAGRERMQARLAHLAENDALGVADAKGDDLDRHAVDVEGRRSDVARDCPWRRERSSAIRSIASRLQGLRPGIGVNRSARTRPCMLASARQPRGKAPHAVARDLGRAAVRVQELHRGAIGPRPEEDHAVGTDPAVTLAQAAREGRPIGPAATSAFVARSRKSLPSACALTNFICGRTPAGASRSGAPRRAAAR